MNILVTGGLGHIGSHLIRVLPDHFKITVVDNLLTQRYCSLFNLCRPITFLDKCISKLTISDLANIDVVIHLAAITNAAGSFNNKSETENINIDLTEDFINKCAVANCKFIFPSSASVYGTPGPIVDEDHDIYLNPQSPYAESKLKIENKLKSYKNDYLILRFGTIFGTSVGMRFHTAINKFCFDASLGKSLTIWKENYEQYRPYLGIDDAVSSIIFFLGNDEWNAKYNVLTDNYKLCDIVTYIKQRRNISINMVDTPLLNQFSYMVSDKKLRGLGFRPEDNLYKSIDSTLTALDKLNG
jgi:nucleoside-diphosphate-sugar epimerase